jgi:hypothetical protein
MTVRVSNHRGPSEAQRRIAKIHNTRRDGTDAILSEQHSDEIILTGDGKAGLPVP